MRLDQRLKAIKEAIVGQTGGKEFMPLSTAATVAACHVNTLRRAIAVGSLKASRRAHNGPLTIWAGDLAQWLCAGEALAAPTPAAPRARRRRRKLKYADGGADEVPATIAPHYGVQGRALSSEMRS